MKSKRFLVQHLFPFLFSVLVLIIFLYSPYKKVFVHYDPSAPPVRDYNEPPFPPRYFINCNADIDAEYSFRSSMHSGIPIVIGSSEMTHSDLKAIPYNFFQDRGIQCIGVGHEGNQLLSIMTQLAVFHEDLDKAKLVIILSPGWFEGGSAKGTPLETFLEYADEHILYYLWYDDEIPKELKDPVYDYVVEHYNEIDSPSSILRAIYYKRSSEKNKILKPVYAPFSSLHQYYMGIKKEIMSNEDHSLIPFTKPELSYYENKGEHRERFSQNWDSLYTNALAEFSSHSNNNPYGIENNYYDQYIKGRSKRKLNIVEEKNNKEFDELKALLALLKHFNCKPLFVMQGLNPLVFENLKELDPLLNSVKEEVMKNNFEYLDLYTSDTTKFIKGTLSDFQHMGEAGWYKVDEKIFDLFLKQDKNEQK